MEEQQMYVVPFSLVGFFFTNKSVEQSIRNDLSPEEMEKLQDIIARFLFTEDIKVALYPSIVPVDQAEDAVEELKDMIFGEEEEE